MEIVARTTHSNGDTNGSTILMIDGDTVLSQYECIFDPEDAVFGRSIMPFSELLPILEIVYRAGLNGEEIHFLNEEEKEEF